jgi:2-phospho-L-lactate guanylyltransferase
MTLHILVPCKSLSAGKSRLSAVIDTKVRRALCVKFLERTLDTALSLVPAARCHVVTDDADAAACGAERGVNAIADPGQGLNDALSVGRDAISAVETDPATLLVLPIDLPLANASVLAEFSATPADVVIAPDRGRTGTNALCLGPAMMRSFVFRFGAGSFAAHQAVSRNGPWRVAIFENARLAFDVDQPADYREWQRESLHSAATRKPSLGWQALSQ